jgi:hypothetical protein
VVSVGHDANPLDDGRTRSGSGPRRLLHLGNCHARICTDHNRCHRHHRAIRADVYNANHYLECRRAVRGRQHPGHGIDSACDLRRNPAVTAEFNESMRAALQDQIDRDYGNDFALSDGYSKGQTHVGRRVISAEQITDWIAVPPGAHGNSLIATVTIDADTAQPITLGDAFTDLDVGLSRLSDRAAAILPTTRAGESFERSGIEPTVANFGNWTASPEGMNIHFGDYQVGSYGIGLITITVPWTDLSDVLAPGMQDVLSS